MPVTIGLGRPVTDEDTDADTESVSVTVGITGLHAWRWDAASGAERIRGDPGEHSRVEHAYS
jgi:hypothetical protein